MNTELLSLGKSAFQQPTAKVELTVRCSDLCDRDTFSKSDPMCVLFKATVNQGEWIEVDRTEVCQNTLSPQWQHKFIVDYRFEERQPLKFEVYDSDSSSRRLSDHDFLGSLQTNLSTIVATNGSFQASLNNSPGVLKRGKMYIRAEELTTTKQEVVIEFSAFQLDKKDFFDKSDPFFVISKSCDKQDYSIVYRSEVIKSNLNPKWKKFHLSMSQLCNGDHGRKLKVEVYDWNAHTNHEFIGQFITTVNELSAAAVEKTKIFLINDLKRARKGKKYKNSGTLQVTTYEVRIRHTFLDYLQGGTNINFSVAIDFTASNGDPNTVESLHYIGVARHGCWSAPIENQYTTAIRAVGEIIAEYDSDGQFPALGFGAKLHPSQPVMHDFFLKLGGDNPMCHGVEGILNAYAKTVPSLTFFGPTNFAPVIRHVSHLAEQYQRDASNYYVLLIITDGVITDMNSTIEAIIYASNLPMSIIIVGVGDADFEDMHKLDSDGGLLKLNRNLFARRDIVQFVSMNKFVDKTTKKWNKSSLAAEVLAEIPAQLTGWMNFMGYLPLHNK